MMSSKIMLVLCASVLLVKSISGQCIGSVLNSGFGNGLYGLGSIGNGLSGCGCGAGLGYSVPTSSGGGLGVASASPISPNGISVQSDNAIEGCLSVAGALPFLGAVGLQGQLPTAGSAGVSYSCGNGNVGITGEGLDAGLGYGLGSYGAAGLGLGSFGLGNAGLFGYGGCGCNGIYQNDYKRNI